MGAPPSILRMRVLCQREKLRRSDDLTRKHRVVSIYATWLLVRTSVTADQVTIASIATGVTAAVLLASPGLLAGLGACLLLYISFLLDQVDGEVARYRKTCSLRGVYLDELRHLVVYAVPVFALGFDVARVQGALWPLAVSFTAAFALALARIEERLPVLILGERATKLVTPGERLDRNVPDRPAVLEPAPAANLLKRSARRGLAGLLASYEVLAHQVLILGWLLLAVVADRGLGLGFVEASFLGAIGVASWAALAASVAARLRPGAIEAEVGTRVRAIVRAVEAPEIEGSKA
jgi:hypothetical protein